MLPETHQNNALYRGRITVRGDFYYILHLMSDYLIVITILIIRALFRLISQKPGILILIQLQVAVLLPIIIHQIITARFTFIHFYTG